MIAQTLALFLTLGSSSAGADEHLLVGAERFREGRFEEALVEFRVAARLGATGTDAYVASALVKLGRNEEAVELFGGGDEPGPDALVDYYRALACWGARLYGCADRLLAGIGERSGPKVSAQAVRLRAEIAVELTRQPSPAAVDWYRGRCADEKRTGRAGLAAAYCREAAAVSARRASAGRDAASADASSARKP